MRLTASLSISLVCRYEEGLALVGAGKVAAVLMAGGQVGVLLCASAT
jgi:hypothetical protein